MTSKKWTHRVVTRMRGIDGRWFDFSDGATFSTVEDAAEYARGFAAGQAAVGITTARYEVRTRERETVGAVEIPTFGGGLRVSGVCQDTAEQTFLEKAERIFIEQERKTRKGEL